MADWSQLPKDLLLLIAKRLETHFDILQFRSVCPTWRASAPLNLKPHPTFRFPIPGLDKNKDEPFISVLSKCTVCLFQSLAENSPTTPLYWLAMLEEDKFGRKHILDPLLFRKPMSVQYPMVLDMSKFHVQELSREYFVEKTPVDYFMFTLRRNLKRVAYLSDNPNNDVDYMVLINQSNFGSFCLLKSGDEAIGIEGKGIDCLDFICFNRKFYAVYSDGRTFYIEPDSGALFPVSKESTVEGYYKFLMESFGSLLLIEGIWKSSYFDTLTSESSLPPEIAFEVFQLDEDLNKWVRLESWGDRIFFVGDYCRFSAPAIPGVDGNCIIYNIRLQTKKEYVFYMGSGLSVHLDDRPDLLQLLLPPSLP